MKTSLLFSSFPFITGEKVTLARMSELDLPELWEIMGDDDNYRFTPTAALTSQGECVRKLSQAEALFREKRAIVLGVYPNGREHRLIGIFEIFDVDPEVEAVTVTCTLHRDAKGLGYGSGALRAVCDYLMDAAGVHRIQARLLPINYRGVLVLERCGFQKEGTIREGFLWPDKGVVDVTIYSLLPTDRRGKKPGQPSYYL